MNVLEEMARRLDEFPEDVRGITIDKVSVDNLRRWHSAVRELVEAAQPFAGSGRLCRALAPFTTTPTQEER
jgi:hypothetical protein